MKNKVYEIIVSILLVIGIIVCTICDVLISNSYTWSLIPISAIVFAWVALLPITRLGKKGMWISLIVLNICIMTYLYVLSNVIKDKNLIFSIGMKMARISIIYLACIFIIFKILKKRKFAAIGFSLLIGIPICININSTLSKMFSQPVIDIWDMLSIFTLFILSIIFFIFEFNAKESSK